VEPGYLDGCEAATGIVNDDSDARIPMYGGSQKSELTNCLLNCHSTINTANSARESTTASGERFGDGWISQLAKDGP